MFKIFLRKERQFRGGKAFSWVPARVESHHVRAGETVETVEIVPGGPTTQLKLGVNEIGFGGVAYRSFAVILVVILFGTGCRSLPPLPPVNLSEPGWTLKEGQAVWRSKRNAPEIAGEIMVATGKDGGTFVQFTKTPFPFIIARTQTNSWQLEVPTRNKRYAAAGHPPERIIWFHLPQALAGLELQKPWSWQAKENQWRLENRSTGQSLEGYFVR